MKNVIKSEWVEFAQKYIEILSSDHLGLNLTSIKNPNDLFVKQVMDSIAPIVQHHEIQTIFEKAKYIIDLGTGGGFPLLPIAKIFSDKIIVGVDARLKKLIAVSDIAKKLNINNSITIHSNFENIYFDLEDCLFISKAVGTVLKVSSQISSKFNSEMLFYKGNNFFNLEVEDLEILKNNEHLLKTYPVVIEGLETRYIVRIRLEKKVPRGTKQLKAFSSLVL